MSLKRTTLATLLALTLLAPAGCSSIETPKVIRKEVRVILSPHPPENPKHLGTAIYLPNINTCIISLAEYPKCLLHEVRHCFEGNWHQGRDSDEDC